jgi:hypothetical protein
MMDKDVAKALLTLSKSIDGVIVQMFAEIDKFDDQGLKSRFNDSVGDLLGFIARDLIFPLENIYPELREGNWYRGTASLFGAALEWARWIDVPCAVTMSLTSRLSMMPALLRMTFAIAAARSSAITTLGRRQPPFPGPRTKENIFLTAYAGHGIVVYSGDGAGLA